MGQCNAIRCANVGPTYSCCLGQDHVIQWLSFVDVLHICFSFIFVRNLGLHCFIFVISEPIIADYVVWVLFIVEDRTVTYNC